MIARVAGGWTVLGTKGRKTGPYPTIQDALDAYNAGIYESCSDGGCMTAKVVSRNQQGVDPIRVVESVDSEPPSLD